MRTLTDGRRVAALCGFALALLILCAPNALAQNAARQQPQPSEEAPAADAASALLSQLNLTAAQVARMREIREQSVPQAQALTRRLNQARRALDESIYSDALDEALVEQRAREVAEAQTALIRHRAQTELRVRRVLTPEQLQTFRDLRINARHEQRIRRRLERGLPVRRPNAPADQTPDARPLQRLRRERRRNALGRP
jgi:Spy/CpxP family protein refolding chaperone